jgi:hypothetical protein
MKSQRLINRIVFVRVGMTIAVSATVPLMISSRARGTAVRDSPSPGRPTSIAGSRSEATFNSA